jgi:hypothetical protein
MTESTVADSKPQQPTLELKIVRRDTHLTEFTVEENYLLTRGMEIAARVSPTSTGEWKVSWPMHSRHFETKEEALAWLEEHKAEVSAIPTYRD